MKIYAGVQKGCGTNKIKCDDRILLGSEVLAEGYFERDFEQSDLLLAVADGVGGRAAGWKAAELILTELGRSQATGMSAEEEKDLLHVVKTMNHNIRSLAMENEEFYGMASTLSLICFSEKDAFVLHLGDTRIYRMYTPEGQTAQQSESELQGYNVLQQLTTDWNLLNYWKTLPEYAHFGDEELMRDKKWNKLISYIGMNPDKLEAEVQIQKNIPRNGMFILTSDGIHDFVDEHEMIAILQQELPMQDKIELLMKLAVDNGSKDDQSIIIAEY